MNALTQWERALRAAEPTPPPTDNPDIEWGQRPNNGTEGDIQRSYTCDRCQVDHPWHRFNAGLREQPDASCRIIMDALVGEHAYPNEEGPPEWGRNSVTGEWVCAKFKGPCRCDR